MASISFTITLSFNETFNDVNFGVVTRYLHCLFSNFRPELSSSLIILEYPRSVSSSISLQVGDSGTNHASELTHSGVSSVIISQLLDATGISTVVFKTLFPVLLDFSDILYSGSATFSLLHITGSEPVYSGNDYQQTWTLSVAPNPQVCYLNGNYTIRFTSSLGLSIVTLFITSDNLCGRVYVGPSLVAAISSYKDAFHTLPSSTFILGQIAYFKVNCHCFLTILRPSLQATTFQFRLQI